ncbi:MAG: hypothetical protein HGB10_08320 [Coriobacteriia bacterium]|nr:hypothetical protein [Coriobacteriia bacterium]
MSSSLVRRALSLTMIVCAVSLFGVLAFAPPAHAVSKKTLEANRARIMTELDGMRVRLQARIDELTSTGSKMQETQTEIDIVSKQLADVEAQLQRQKLGLATRAAELYKGDRIGMINVLLSSENIEDLILKTQYLILINQRDASALNDARLMRSESLWLQESLNRRYDRLGALQAKADAERMRIDTDIRKAETRAAAIDADLAELLRQSQTPTTGGDTSGSFNPDLVLTDANFRSQDMTETGIQAFLDRQAGPLKSYTAKDHNGNTKSAAKIIAEASAAWKVSPRVILITLQKEQSLLSKRPTKQSTYDWALGVGRPDSGISQMKYKGFGNQVWYGAKSFNTGANLWRAGKVLKIDSSTVIPANGATYAQYRYTPHLHGVTNFWSLWIRYFNDNPAK